LDPLEPPGAWLGGMGEEVISGECPGGFVKFLDVSGVSSEPYAAIFRFTDSGGVKVLRFREVFQLTGSKVVSIDIIKTKEPQIAFIICLYPVDLYEGVNDADQFLLFLVEAEKAILSSYPEGAVLIAVEAVDHIAAQCAFVVIAIGE